MSLRRVAAAVSLALPCCPCLAEPPRLVHAAPDHADAGVDPATSELRFEFDQDMRGGRSICGGGPNFPPIAGEIVWESSRVLVVPVKLEPGRTYEFSLNCPAATNFRSVDGEPLVPTPMRFTTARAGEAPTPPVAMTEEKARAGLDALRRAIDERYSYRDLRVPDWSGVFGAHERRVLGAPTRAAFARACAELLSAAGDVHMSLRIGDAWFPTHRADVRPNADIKRLERAVPGWKAHGRHIATGRFEDGIGYIAVFSWAGVHADFEPAFEALDAMKDAPAIVVDARFNSGGDEVLARSFAERFVAQRTVYSKNRCRDPSSPAGWTEVYDRVVEPSAASVAFRGKAVVLIGGACMSSNESFIAMMKHGAGATLVGETTYGSSANPKPVELADTGVTLVCPSWEDRLPDGTVLEGGGIKPDVRAEWNGGPGDPVLGKALELLRQN